MRQGLLLFVLARLFAHLKLPHTVGITAMIVCLHCVVGAKLFSTSLPVSAFSSVSLLFNSTVGLFFVFFYLF